MAAIYVKAGASNTSPFDTWAKAATTLAGATAIATNADTIYVSSTHSEAPAVDVTYTLPSTPGLQILSVDDSSEPPTTLAIGGTIASATLNVDITIIGHAYIYGLKFGTGSTGASIITIGGSSVPHVLYFDYCWFDEGTTSSAASSQIVIGQASASGINDNAEYRFDNCKFEFGNAAQEIVLRYGRIRFRNMILVGTIDPVFLFNLSSSYTNDVVLEASDLSGQDFGGLFTINGALTVSVIVRNCRMPVGATFIGSVPSVAGSLRFVADNVDTTDTQYTKYIIDYAGLHTHDTANTRTDGASNGTTAISWSLASAAGTLFPQIPLRSTEIVRWNSTVGTPITVDCEIIHDSIGGGTAGALTDKEIFLEVQYLGTSGFPVATIINDAAVSPMATATDHASSSAGWTTSLSTPKKQKLSVTFTPQEIGYIHATVCLTKPSVTVYACPKLTVT